MAKSLSPLTHFPVRGETATCSHILTQKWRLVLTLKPPRWNLQAMLEHKKTGILSSILSSPFTFIININMIL